MAGMPQKIRAYKDQLQETSTINLGEIVSWVLGLHEEIQSKISQSDDFSPFIDTMCELKDLMEILKARVERIETENKKLKRKVEDLEKALQHLEEIQSTLVAGQVAFEVDKAVLKCVMEAIERPDYEDLHIFNIFNMEKAIRREDNYKDIFTEEECKKADSHWEMLKQKIGWKGFHYRCLGKLKDSRTQMAHPHVDIKKMEQHLSKAHLSTEEKRSCTELLKVLKKLKQL